MKPNWAEENLQTIRTLMERSALYRRALAPIMLFAGTLGLAAMIFGVWLSLKSVEVFYLLWLGTAILVVIGAFLIARRQALKDKEAFWSAPTRRVAQALVPPLIAGLCVGGLPAFFPSASDELAVCSTVVWVMFYGCALHAAGFIMPRGIKFLGWIYMAASGVLFYLLMLGWINFNFSAHWLMGLFFGGFHLAYGIYLYFTEKKTPAA